MSQMLSNPRNAPVSRGISKSTYIKWKHNHLNQVREADFNQNLIILHFAFYIFNIKATPLKGYLL